MGESVRLDNWGSERNREGWGYRSQSSDLGSPYSYQLQPLSKDTSQRLCPFAEIIQKMPHLARELMAVLPDLDPQPMGHTGHGACSLVTARQASLVGSPAYRLSIASSPTWSLVRDPGSCRQPGLGREPGPQACLNFEESLWPCITRELNNDPGSLQAQLKVPLSAGPHSSAQAVVPQDCCEACSFCRGQAQPLTQLNGTALLSAPCDQGPLIRSEFLTSEDSLHRAWPTSGAQPSVYLVAKPSLWLCLASGQRLGHRVEPFQTGSPAST